MQPSSGWHGLEGLKHIPTAIRPGIYDESVHDVLLDVETEDAYDLARRLARTEGILAGHSCGAALWGAGRGHPRPQLGGGGDDLSRRRRPLPVRRPLHRAVIGCGYPAELRQHMRAMGEKAYPNEGCGILLGHFGAEAEVVEVRGGTNLREDRARDRYILDPPTSSGRALRADDAGLEIVGFWHTHPDHPARPSQYDADHARREYVYVIWPARQEGADRH